MEIFEERNSLVISTQKIQERMTIYLPFQHALQFYLFVFFPLQ